MILRNVRKSQQHFLTGVECWEGGYYCIILGEREWPVVFALKCTRNGIYNAYGDTVLSRIFRCWFHGMYEKFPIGVVDRLFLQTHPLIEKESALSESETGLASRG